MLAVEVIADIEDVSLELDEFDELLESELELEEEFDDELELDEELEDELELS